MTNLFLKIVERPMFKSLIIVAILINALTLGLETDPDIVAKYGNLLEILDVLILYIFITEISMRIIAYKLAFFKDPWSIFDFIVVGITLVPQSGNLSILRTLRVLRVLRLISVVPAMRHVITGLLSSLSGIASVSAIMLVIYYVFSVIATKVFGEANYELFGTMGKSMFTLFQIMTLEGWADIARPIISAQPYAWIFFVCYILCSTFIVLNLFIGVMVNAMQTAFNNSEAQKKKKATLKAERETLVNEVRSLKGEISDLKETIINKL